MLGLPSYGLDSPSIQCSLEMRMPLLVKLVRVRASPNLMHRGVSCRCSRIVLVQVRAIFHARLVIFGQRIGAGCGVLLLLLLLRLDRQQ